jgi:hypothetical protein
MARLFAYEDVTYQHNLKRQKIEKGAVVNLEDESLVARLMAKHPDNLLQLGPDEDAPNLYSTTMKVTPDMDRTMRPRLSPQKRQQLRAAKRRSRHAYLTIIP